MTNRNEIIALTADMEELWRAIDAAFDSLSKKDWESKHGEDWVFADIPFHINYYDDSIATNLELGAALPADLQLEYSTAQQLNNWNAELFAQRPQGKSLESEIAQSEATRDRLRKIFAAMTDTDLDEPAWYRNMMFRGWRTKRWVIGMLAFHTFDHLLEIRARLNTDKFRPAPATVNSSLQALVENAISGFIDHNKSLVPGSVFKITSEFLGEGGGAWTHTCTKEGIQVHSGADADTDIIVSMTPETFTLIGKGMLTPMVALESGDLKVSSLDNFPTYGVLTALPGLDEETQPFQLQ